jgi:hypothetical protein
MKFLAIVLILSCLAVGLTSIPARVKADDGTCVGWQIGAYVTGKGTYISRYYDDEVLLCDDGKIYNNTGRFPIFSHEINVTERVIFTIGVNITFQYVGNTSAVRTLEFMTINMQPLQSYVDFFWMTRLFNSMYKEVIVHTNDVPLEFWISRKSAYGLDYNKQYDLNNDGMIDMHDIRMSILYVQQVSK